MCVSLSTRLCNLLLVSGGPHLLLIKLQRENQDCKTYIYIYIYICEICREICLAQQKLKVNMLQ
jgi:hypothetical protein